MCTSIRYKNKDAYFGRNLDVEFSFLEEVVVTPRKRTFHLKNGKKFENQYALIGIAAVVEDYPLYYEAANEVGLAGAGLNFPGNALYNEEKEGFDNISPFEFLPYILGSCKTCKEAKSAIFNINLTNKVFNEKMPLSPLHFMFADENESFVVEQMKDGMHIYDNPFDVMTNNPPFDYHLKNMDNYLNLSTKNRENTFSKAYSLQNYGVGMGAMGLPGDCSSASRFVRAAFHLTNGECGDSEEEKVSEFFHILDSVAMVKGAVKTDRGENDITLYSCCINLTKGVFYYKTYDNNQITAVKLLEEDMEGKNLRIYPLRKKQNILFEN